MQKAMLFCFVVQVTILSIEGNPHSVCPGGRRPVHCFINPCDLPQLKSCNNNPTLECRANYCKGCEHVEFYDVTGVKVNCNEGYIAQNDEQQIEDVGEPPNSNDWPFMDLYLSIRSLFTP
ncbi:uncharacterized protein LOC132559371 [Ylistrum balloti]|uniref:uncharacterized protein LOC132559371 n=1 Tax=Ylistrum balloti TaxID=509963 RepID=UPI002905A47E|nr:uncharacterized protein LOC132559371 [Ylistrum balloti]